MANQDYETAEDLVERWLKGYLEGMSKTNQKLIPLIEQLCRDLNEAHNEILRQQGVAESDFSKYDWPEWSNQANSIRWAEDVLKKKLAKTGHWTLYPTGAKDTTRADAGKRGSIH